MARVDTARPEPEEFSFQQTFGERFGRAASQAIPVGAAFVGYGVGMLMSPDQKDLSYGPAVFSVVFALLGILCYTLWMASMNMYLEGPRLGFDDLLRTTGKGLVSAFMGGGIHALVVWGMRH